MSEKSKKKMNHLGSYARVKMSIIRVLEICNDKPWVKWAKSWAYLGFVKRHRFVETAEALWDKKRYGSVIYNMAIPLTIPETIEAACKATILATTAFTLGNYRQAEIDASWAKYWALKVAGAKGVLSPEEYRDATCKFRKAK